MTTEGNSSPKSKTKVLQRQHLIAGMESTTPGFYSSSSVRLENGSLQKRADAENYTKVVMRQLAGDISLSMPTGRTTRPFRQSALLQLQRRQGNSYVISQMRKQPARLMESPPKLQRDEEKEDAIEYTFDADVDRAREVGEQHAAIIRKEGFEKIRDEIKENADTFVDEANEIYLKLIREAYQEYQVQQGVPRIGADIAAFRTHPLVRRIEGSIQAAKPSQEGTIRNEEVGAVRQEVNKKIKQIRGQIDRLTADELKADKESLKSVKAYLYGELATLTPYYSQGSNANILPHPTEGNAASSRTCNVTALAMVLEGLGKSSQDWQGNKQLLQLIANFYSGKFGEETPAKFKTDATDVLSWRLPDFLQVAVIYNELVNTNMAQEADKLARQALELSEGTVPKKQSKAFATEKKTQLATLETNKGDFVSNLLDQLQTQQEDKPDDYGKRIRSAQKVAAKKITNSAVFEKMGRYFGVKAEHKSSPHATYLTEFGRYNRAFKRDAEKEAENQVKKEARDKVELEAEELAKEKLNKEGKKLTKKNLNREKKKQRKILKQAEAQALAAKIDKLAQEALAQAGKEATKKNLSREKKKQKQILESKKKEEKEARIAQLAEKILAEKREDTVTGWLDTYVHSIIEEDVNVDWLQEITQDNEGFKMPKKRKDIEKTLKKLLKPIAKEALKGEGKKSGGKQVNKRVEQMLKERYEAKANEESEDIKAQIERGEIDRRGLKGGKEWVGAEAADSEAKMESVVAMEDYKDWVIKEMTAARSKGQEVIVNLFNHFVRFEGFYEGGIIEDDPGRYSRKSNKVPWSEARQKGYFRRFTALK